jgi:GNAT superfamily N-acetyltransferase
MADYTIKTMSLDNLKQAIAWAAAEGWNPGLHDAECFYAADPTGFLMGCLEDEPIASIAVVKYGHRFGFLGLYIVKPDFRGQGYGWRLWQTGLASLDNRIIGLDGVVEQQSNYLKSGFQLAYRNIRYEGFQTDELTTVTSSLVVPLKALPWAEIIQYDQAFFPDERHAFLRAWLTQPDSHGLGLRLQNQLVGYGVIRRCQHGYKLGPLFADTPEFAEALFLALRAQVPIGSPFYLDVPEVNKAAMALAAGYGLKSMFETARMYTPHVPDLPLDRIFGVTSFELG